MLQEDSNDDNVDGEDHDNYEDTDNDDDNVDGEDHNYEDSDNDELRSNNDEESDAIPLENEENDYAMFLESDEDYAMFLESDKDYAMFLESDEDYAMFLGSDEDSSSDSDADTSSEEKIFVDAALDEDKLPSFDSDFAPYFKDFTTAALFCWIYKHNISTNAYENLIDIIMKPEFNRDHNCKEYLKILNIEGTSSPFLNISKIYLNSSKKMPSTSKNSKMAYQLSISDII